MTTYVIDTSALVKYVVAENHSNAVRAIVASHHSAAIRLIAPEFILAECANVLWKYIRRSDWSVADALAALRELRSLNIPLVPQDELLDDALVFAGETGTVVYDALFAVLARRENAPLLTADIPLANRLSAAGIPALALSGRAEP